MKIKKTQPLSLEQHLIELRKRILNSGLVVLVVFICCWIFSNQIMDIIRQPIQPFLKNTGGGLVFTAPMDQFLAHIQVSFVSALLISSPYWLHQAWLFYCSWTL